jgi:hypothetical protein
MILALGLYVVDDIGSLPMRQADAQFGAPEGETPQRMCVGMIKEKVLIGFERTKKTRKSDGKKYDTLDWYHGDLESARISPSVIQTASIEGQTSTLLRRWQWEEGRLWLVFEGLYGSFGTYTSELWRSTSPDERCAKLEESNDVPPPPDQRVLSEKCKGDVRPFSTGEEIEQLSWLDPLTVRGGGVDPVNPGWSTPAETRELFCHRNGGFDIIPHAVDHWTLLMTVGHTMQIWDCRSKRVATEEGEEIRNTWTLVTELWVPWSGQFFAFERYSHHEYVFVRDCGEVYLLRLEKDLHTNKPKLRQGNVWLGRQLLDPVDYLIALIYIEPENTVYGFGLEHWHVR